MSTPSATFDFTITRDELITLAFVEVKQTVIGPIDSRVGVVRETRIRVHNNAE